MVDFFQLILHGFEKERNYFPEYLLREQKKAEKQDFLSEEFFSKCFEVVEELKKILDTPIVDEKLHDYKVLKFSKKELEQFSGEIADLSFENIEEIEDQILEAVRLHDFNSFGDRQKIFDQYRNTKNLRLLFPFRMPFRPIEKWEKLDVYRKGLFYRHSYFIAHLYPDDQEELNTALSGHFQKMIEAQTEKDYKKILRYFLGLLQRSYEVRYKNDVQIPDLEHRKQHYQKSKNIMDIFPYPPGLWKFHNWNKFISFLDFTMTTFIYIYDRLNEHDQFELKWDLKDYLSKSVERESTTKYKKALINFSNQITNYNGFISKEEANADNRKKIIHSLSLFFKEGTKPDQIEKIQNEFRNLRNKEMAALIYSLENRGLITYDNSINSKSRINLVRALTGLNNLSNIAGINKYFQANTHNSRLVYPNGKKDKTLIIIEEQLDKVVDSC